VDFLLTWNFKHIHHDAKQTKRIFAPFAPLRPTGRLVADGLLAPSLNSDSFWPASINS